MTISESSKIISPSNVRAAGRWWPANLALRSSAANSSRRSRGTSVSSSCRMKARTSSRGIHCDRVARPEVIRTTCVKQPKVCHAFQSTSRRATQGPVDWKGIQKQLEQTQNAEETEPPERNLARGAALANVGGALGNVWATYGAPNSLLLLLFVSEWLHGEKWHVGLILALNNLGPTLEPAGAWLMERLGRRKAL